jgi:hypothetical protein
MMMNKKLWYATCRFSSRVPDAIISWTLASNWSYTSYSPWLAWEASNKKYVAYKKGVGHLRC